MSARTATPLRHRRFRALWIAALTANLGIWIYDLGAVWLMTSLTSSPLLIALIQTAMNLPIVLLALPAGALADIVDRRWLLLFTQAWMLVAVALLAVMTLQGSITPWALLVLALVIGVGDALNAPAWQAIIPELVPSELIPAAVTLSGLGLNLARALGPALGGLIVATGGPPAAFGVTCLAIALVLGVVGRWRRVHVPSALPAERVAEAMRAGLRYARHAPALKAVLVRTASFIAFGSALWALLPHYSRFELGWGPAGYGILLGLFGLGAVGTAVMLERLRRRLSVDALVGLFTALFALVAILLGSLRLAPAIVLAMPFAGGAWLALLTIFNTSTLTVVPEWVRGRALALYLMVFFGGLAGGAAVWGAVAQALGTQPALVISGLGLLVTLLLAPHYRLAVHSPLDLSPAGHWPSPSVSLEPRHDEGPVFVLIPYRIDPQQAPAFIAAMAEMRLIRLGDGAMRWNLIQDMQTPSRFVETFVVESWLDYLRQHDRITVADRAVEDRVRAFHLGPGDPTPSLFLARNPR